PRTRAGDPPDPERARPRRAGRTGRPGRPRPVRADGAVLLHGARARPDAGRTVRAGVLVLPGGDPGLPVRPPGRGTPGVGPPATGEAVPLVHAVPRLRAAHVAPPGRVALTPRSAAASAQLNSPRPARTAPQRPGRLPGAGWAPG